MLIELRLENKVISKVKVPIDLELKFLTADGGERIHLKYVPIVASLPLKYRAFNEISKVSYGDTRLEVVVSLLESQKKKEIFKSFVIKWK